jgi:hypothetical protein
LLKLSECFLAMATPTRPSFIDMSFFIMPGLILHPHAWTLHPSTEPHLTPHYAAAKGKEGATWCRGANTPYDPRLSIGKPPHVVPPALASIKPRTTPPPQGSEVPALPSHCELV